MSYDNARAITLTPDTALLRKNRFAGIDSSGNLAYPASGGDVVGIALQESVAGSVIPIPVALLDGAILKLECDAGVSAGDRIISTASGRGATGSVATQRVLGIALESVVNGGDVIRVVGLKAAGEWVA